MNKKPWLIVFAVLVLFLTGTVGFAYQRNDGGYYTIVDESGVAVYVTGWKVRPGDQCLSEKNMRYEVVSVEGDIAHARTIRRSQFEPILA